MSARGGRAAVRLLASAEAISAIGTLAAYTAVTYEVYRLTQSAYWVSIAAFMSFALAGAAAPVAGWLADRFDRRRVMIASDVAAAGVYAVAAVAGNAPALLVAVTALGTVAAAPFRPAVMAALPNLVSEDELHRANGLVSSAHSVGIILGPIAGGSLIAASGTGGAFAVNAVSFAVSALLVARVRGSFAAPGRVATTDGDRLAGFRVARRSPLLRALIVAEAALAVGVGFGFSADAPLADSLDAGPGGYAAIITAWGFGSVAAGAAMSRWPQREPGADLAALAGGLVLIALAMAGTAGLPTLAPIVAVQFVGGVGMTAVFVLRNTVVQRVVEDDVRGRVFGSLDAVISAGSVVGLGFAGLLVEQAGVRPAYAAAALLIGSGAAWTFAATRGSRRAFPPAPAP